MKQTDTKGAKRKQKDTKSRSRKLGVMLPDAMVGRLEDIAQRERRTLKATVQIALEAFFASYASQQQQTRTSA